MASIPGLKTIQKFIKRLIQVLTGSKENISSRGDGSSNNITQDQYDNNSQKLSRPSKTMNPEAQARLDAISEDLSQFRQGVLSTVPHNEKVTNIAQKPEVQQMKTNEQNDSLLLKQIRQGSKHLKPIDKNEAKKSNDPREALLKDIKAGKSLKTTDKNEAKKSNDPREALLKDIKAGKSLKTTDKNETKKSNDPREALLKDIKAGKKLKHVAQNDQKAIPTTQKAINSKPVMGGEVLKEKKSILKKQPTLQQQPQKSVRFALDQPNTQKTHLSTDVSNSEQQLKLNTEANTKIPSALDPPKSKASTNKKVNFAVDQPKSQKTHLKTDRTNQQQQRLETLKDQLKELNTKQSRTNNSRQQQLSSNSNKPLSGQKFTDRIAQQSENNTGRGR